MAMQVDTGLSIGFGAFIEGTYENDTIAQLCATQNKFEPNQTSMVRHRRVPRVATPQQHGGREEGEAGEGEGAGVCGARDECGVEAVWMGAGRIGMGRRRSGRGPTYALHSGAL